MTSWQREVGLGAVGVVLFAGFVLLWIYDKSSSGIEQHWGIACGDRPSERVQSLERSAQGWRYVNAAGHRVVTSETCVAVEGAP